MILPISIMVTSAKKPSAKRWLSGIRAAPLNLPQKMPLRDFKDTADLETIFNEQRTNCGVDYFDYYLLHNMGTNVYEKCRKYGAFDFIAAKFENSNAYPQRK